jgi:enoyl-CoA hydratase
VELETMIYERDGRIARITLDRPDRGNGITLEMPRELAACVERANLDPEVHVIALAGNGSGFCGGYDLVTSAEQMSREQMPDTSSASPPGVSGSESGRPAGSPLDASVVAENHDPSRVWDPVVDYQMMSRNVRGFMSLFWSEKPVVCKVHGYCVAGGTDFALCCDLIVCAEDCRIGYPPARVWGSPTTAMWMYRLGLERSKRLLLTGDAIDGRRAVEWGLASEAVPADELEAAGLSLARRVALLPHNQAAMMKLLVNQAFEQMGLHTTQLIGTLLDGAARHTPEGTAFTQRGLADVRGAVADRDAPFGDYGQGPATV